MECAGNWDELVVSSSLRQSGNEPNFWRICEIPSKQTYMCRRSACWFIPEKKDILLARGIEVVFQYYEHPEYKQLFPPFQPFASVLDLIFNEGPRSRGPLRGGRRPPFRAKWLLTTSVRIWCAVTPTLQIGTRTIGPGQPLT